ncbi:MAG TPA: protein kinase [Gemmatimonadales bacterium]|nr:protein kinase [Gemmatimonadales bacterium]
MSRLGSALAGRYRIERELGAGGMATVYLAHDERHDRKLALKVLRPELSAILGGERFLAEIKTTANLQHPHILSLFDSGEADGLVYYVMPYVEGESLRDRLTREKQLPVEEAIAIAREVADALSYAHGHGVVHRDIKPENIMLAGGHALVADFGIALAASRTGGGTRLTETGMSLGTPHYMAPEQAMGEREITPKADIYALGCVTYEMLAGEPPFTGPTAQAIIAQVLTEEPRSLTLQRRTIPPHVQAAVECALQKLPADRFATAALFAEALQKPDAPARRRADAPAPSALAAARRPLYAALALCAVLGVAALVGWLRPRSAPATSRQRVVLWHYPLGQLLDPGLQHPGTQAAIAPDGSSIVYTDSTGGTLHLVRKMRDADVATPMAGTEGALSPFFSPDGRWVGYATAFGTLRKVPVDGGGSVTLVAHTDPVYAAAAWLEDGTIVFMGAHGPNRISAAGGASRALFRDSTRAARSVLTLWPLPGSRGFLYTLCPANCAIGSDVYVFDFAADSGRLLVANAAGAWYAPPGYLLYTDRAGGLFAAGFDATKLRLTSEAVPVIPDVVPGTFTLSASGAALYVTTAGPSVPAELMWVSRNGAAVPFDSTWRADFQYPALSPDGRMLAVSVRDATTQLWIRRADGTRQRLTQDGTVNWRPAWTRDGHAVVFSSNRRGTGAQADFDLYEMPVSGTAPATLLQHWSYPVWEGQISPDGSWLVWRADEANEASHIRGRRVAGDTAVVPLVVGPGATTQIALSPDGRWLAFTGDATGREEIYAAPFPGIAFTRQVSRDGGTEPRWAHSGRELFYRTQDRLMVVPVAPGPALALGLPRALFATVGYRAARNRQEYDVAPDDRRFLMILDLALSTNSVVYVEHWLPELRAKVRSSR